VLELQDRAQPLAEESVVVDEHHPPFPDRIHAILLAGAPLSLVIGSNGTSTDISAPSPALLRMRSSPPRAVVRSRMDQGAAAGSRYPSGSMMPRVFWTPR